MPLLVLVRRELFLEGLVERKGEFPYGYRLLIIDQSHSCTFIRPANSLAHRRNPSFTLYPYSTPTQRIYDPTWFTRHLACFTKHLSKSGQEFRI